MLMFLRFAAIVACLSNASTAWPQSLDAAKDAEFLKAAAARLTCLGEWESRLASSTDPIEIVAEAVMQQCQKEIIAADEAAKASMSHLGPDDFKELRVILKKAVMTRLVIWRVAAQKAKAREGKQ